MATMPTAGGYFMASPVGGHRVQVAPQPRVVTAPGPVYHLAQPGAMGPSFVAAPRQAQPVMISATAPSMMAYGAPTMPFRPSYVAAHPATMPSVPQPAVMTYAPSSTSVVQLKASTAAPAPAPTAAPAPAPVQVSRAAPVPPPTPAVPREYVEALERRVADLELIHACKTHSAVVFIKPHAVTEEVKELVKAEFANRGIYVLSEGVIPAEEIDQQQLIDTHYGAIAAKAVKLSPSELTVQPKAQEEFEQAFGLTWSDAVSQGAVFNAMQGGEALGITPEELGARWGTLSKGVDMLKFGGGFYCGRIEDVFIINGFYMNMRSKFTTPGTCIYYFETEWDARMLSWQDFRAKVLGATDPAAAVEGSIRNLIFTNWEALGLAACPDTGDNGVHASASPFEALAERANWLNIPIENDFFGRALLASGIPLATVQEWCSDPAVMFDGAKHSLFDLLEDLSSRECLQKASVIASDAAQEEAENEHANGDVPAPEEG